MSREEELLQQIGALRQELWQVQDEKKRAENEALVGKCFVYTNSAGSDNPEWPFYFKVVGVDEDGDLQTFGFEADYRGCYRIDRDWSGGLVESSTEIPEEELVTAWLQMQQDLAKIGKKFG